MIRWSGQGVGGGWGCVGADKERGRTIWVAWSRSSSLSAAETLHAFFLFFFFSENFHLRSQISCVFVATHADKKQKREEAGIVQHAGFIHINQRRQTSVGGGGWGGGDVRLKLGAVVGEGEKSFK